MMKGKQAAHDAQLERIKRVGEELQSRFLGDEAYKMRLTSPDGTKYDMRLVSVNYEIGADNTRLCFDVRESEQEDDT